jgi:RNA polymerase sigma-70 factor (ECF subfamily)
MTEPVRPTQSTGSMALAPAVLPPVSDERPVLADVYAAHFNHVWHTLRRLGVHSRDLEDVAHEVFLVVHRRLPDFDPARPVRPWLTGIAYKTASDWRRRARHRFEVLDDEPQPLEPPMLATEQEAAVREARALVARALDALDLERRVVFVMHDLDGCTAQEIAAALEIPLNTVYSRLRTARLRFENAVRRLRRRRGEP